jgi:hypothetical protein
VQGFSADAIDDNDNALYKEEVWFFTPEMYRNTGAACLIALLDVFEKNPYSRLPNTQYKNLETLRRELAMDCARTERYKRIFVIRSTIFLLDYIFIIKKNYTPIDSVVNQEPIQERARQTN